MQICVQEPSGRGERESAAAHTEARSLNPSQLFLWDHLRGGLTPWKMRSPSLGENVCVKRKGNVDSRLVCACVRACWKSLPWCGSGVVFLRFPLTPPPLLPPKNLKSKVSCVVGDKCEEADFCT